MRTLLAAVAIVAVACGGGAVDATDLPAARVSGEVCRVPLLAGAVVVGDDLVLTAAHVVAGAEGGLSVSVGPDVRSAAVVVGFDAERDLALLRAPGVQAEPIELADGARGETGVIVGRDRSGELTVVRHEVGRQITATGEEVVGSGTRRALELNADIAAGMSGSGAFDDDGRLLGIVFAESRERAITYAVAATEIEAFLAEVDATTEADAGQC